MKWSLFSRKQKPHFDIMINGMSCITYGREFSFENQTSHHETGSSYFAKSYESIEEVKNQIIGNSMIAFINLPMNSRVYINYNGEHHAEGFMSLRKI